MPSFLVSLPASALAGSTLLWAVAEAWRARPHFKSSITSAVILLVSARRWPSPASVREEINPLQRKGGKLTWHRACVREVQFIIILWFQQQNTSCLLLIQTLMVPSFECFTDGHEQNMGMFLKCHLHKKGQFCQTHDFLSPVMLCKCLWVAVGRGRITNWKIFRYSYLKKRSILGKSLSPEPLTP